MSKLAKAAYLGGALATCGILATRVRSGKTSELDARITRQLQTIEDPTFDKVMHTV
ncbi:MAG: hypothetical protein IT335_04865, partial [Thermomicrobiales bacterium]|nr:hypothetical protein [Thermomicrobiales bacterium]